MKKFNFRKVLDGLTASSPGGSGGGGGGSGAGGGSVHPAGTAGAAGTPRDEVQETLTSDYFQICKVRAIISIHFYYGNNKSYSACVFFFEGGSNVMPISLFTRELQWLYKDFGNEKTALVFCLFVVLFCFFLTAVELG